MTIILFNVKPIKTLIHFLYMTVSRKGVSLEFYLLNVSMNYGRERKHTNKPFKVYKWSQLRILTWNFFLFLYAWIKLQKWIIIDWCNRIIATGKYEIVCCLLVTNWMTQLCYFFQESVSKTEAFYHGDVVFFCIPNLHSKVMKICRVV